MRHIIYACWKLAVNTAWSESCVTLGGQVAAFQILTLGTNTSHFRNQGIAPQRP